MAAQQVAAGSAASSTDPLPVREVTVFKDGHAYVLREGPLAGGTLRDVVLDDLPAPVLGTFWPYATQGARLVHAKAGLEASTREVEVLDLRQLLEANTGRKVELKDHSNDLVVGTLRGVPRRDQQSASFVLLETASGVRAQAIDQVRWIQIEGQPARTIVEKHTSERLELRVEGGTDQSRVGVAYVQQGLRWLPAYKLDIDGAGKAQVQLEATLVNDLIDLNDATVNLVIGVPSFEFAGIHDPISLQNEMAAVAARMEGQQAFSNMLSNSLMTQSAGYRVREAAPGEVNNPQATLQGSEANEDLFVFTIAHVSLKKGERMVLPLREFRLEYRDVYKLDIPFEAPVEVRQQLPSERVLQLARELAQPKVIHLLRLRNDSDAPITTAPALVLAKGRVLAQGRLRYTPRGLETDLAINPAIEICVELDERETGRTPDAQTWNNDRYGRIDLAGTIRLRNEKSVPVEIEVTRRVLGLVREVAGGGTQKQLDMASMARELQDTRWWGWVSWPYWWFRFNGVGEFHWTVKLDPKQQTQLESSWFYFWR